MGFVRGKTCVWWTCRSSPNTLLEHRHHSLLSTSPLCLRRHVFMWRNADVSSHGYGHGKQSCAMLFRSQCSIGDIDTFSEIMVRKWRWGINIHPLNQLDDSHGERELERKSVWRKMGQGVVTGEKPPTLTTKAWLMQFGWHTAVGQGHYTGSPL